MSKLLSIPMYDVNHADTEALLRALRQVLSEEGLDGDKPAFLGLTNYLVCCRFLFGIPTALIVICT